MNARRSDSADSAAETPRGEGYERFSRTVDGPLTILALALIPLLIVPAVFDLSEGIESAILIADYVIWAIFVVEYVTKLVLSPNRGLFFRKHIPDLILVVVPMLRPLRVLRSVRVLRLARLVRVASGLGKGFTHIRSIFGSRGLGYVLVIVLVVAGAGAVLVLEFERDIEAGNIKNLADAIWWSVTTITTVGYGDRFPVSAGGRGVAVVLMITGIALFGVLTAAIAAFFVDQDRDKTPDVEVQLEEIAARLERMERRLEGGPEGR